jgi:hypothetical protein
MQIKRSHVQQIGAVALVLGMGGGLWLSGGGHVTAQKPFILLFVLGVVLYASFARN